MKKIIYFTLGLKILLFTNDTSTLNSYTCKKFVTFMFVGTCFLNGVFRMAYDLSDDNAVDFLKQALPALAYIAKTYVDLNNDPALNNDDDLN